MILAALQQFLSNDPSIASRLAVWDFGDSIKRPAIFAEREPPHGCGSPLICMELDGIELWEATRKDWGGRIHNITARLWGQDLGSNKALRAFAGTLWERLNSCNADKSALPLPQNVTLDRIKISGPKSVESDDGFPGYDFQLEVKITDRRNLQ